MPEAADVEEVKTFRRHSGKVAGPPQDFEGDVQGAAQHLRSFLEKREGSALRAWLRHFDKNNDQRISKMEFSQGMRDMDYPGDCAGLFASLDVDKSGELTLDELHYSHAMLWRAFRQWAMSKFHSAEDMLNRLARPAKYGGGSRKSTLAPVESVGLDEFRDGVITEGWGGGCEDIVFSAMHSGGDARLSLENLRWLDIDKRRQRRKEQARSRALQEQKRKPVKDLAHHLEDFKAFLKKKYGSFLRAWRVALSQNDSTVLQKPRFLKACASLGWHGDLKLLWQAFDKDDSGFASLDEWDPKSATVLARFKEFVDTKFGNSKAAFKAIATPGASKVSQQDFIDGLVKHGFQYPARQLFHGLDRGGNKTISESDLHFLDRWRPLEFLLAKPNPEAKQQFKDLCLFRCKSFLKAWRHLLDRDSTNRCNWWEFQSACKKLAFPGDVSGAWRALDEDLSGYITLNELDPEASRTLLEFRRWALHEFGSVKSAFQVFDIDGSGELSFREFRRACRIYGYEGSTRELFFAFDTSNEGSLSLNEVSFLDEWDMQSAEELPEWPTEQPEHSGVSPRQQSRPLVQALAQPLTQPLLQPVAARAGAHRRGAALF